MSSASTRGVQRAQELRERNEENTMNAANGHDGGGSGNDKSSDNAPKQDQQVIQIQNKIKPLNLGLFVFQCRNQLINNIYGVTYGNDFNIFYLFSNIKYF
jgi:hypothetical protein